MANSWLTLTILAYSGFVLVSSLCPDQWIEHAQECLYFSPHKDTWQNAETACRKSSSYLTTDDTEDKHDFLKLYLNIFKSWHLSHFWLGGSDNAIEGQWRWIETGGAISGLSRWDVGQPDGNSTANCMSFSLNANNSLVWRDSPCSHKNNYICEKPATTASIVIG